MDNITELRQAINDIDAQIVALFVRRMEVCGGIARVKMACGMPVLDSAREEAVLDSVAGMAGGFGDDARALYRTIMERSRLYQRHLMAQENTSGSERQR